MKVVLAVLQDLFTFAVVYRFGLRSDMPAPKPITEEKSESIAEYTQTIKQVTDSDSLLLIAPVPAPAGLLPPTPQPVVKPQPEESMTGVGYACTPTTSLYALPTRTFDGVITRLSYGASFQILNTQGKWHSVLYKDIRGWVQVDEVTTSNAVLTPQFHVGGFYGFENPETVKLRSYICDEFSAVVLAVPLQSVEFVAFKLKRRGLKITWPAIRPRIAGTWQKILRGVTGIHMGVSPKTGSLMEYATEENVGHVAYVDSVYPDGGITISEIGYPAEGVYSERTLGQHEWRELRPVFIEVA